jgi:hypothetical protein
MVLEKLTKEYIDAYNSDAGIRLLIDVDSKEIFNADNVDKIHSDNYHIATELLEMTEHEIRYCPLAAAHLVSANILLEGYKVSRLNLGYGSLENRLKVGHSKHQLESAYQIFQRFIDDIEKTPDYKERKASPEVFPNLPEVKRDKKLNTKN